MSLLDLWNSAKTEIEAKQLPQIISFAGNGKLADKTTSHEFRSFLHYIPSDLLVRYAHECLTSKFEQSGFALQDLVNQIGRRLSFDVIDGIYRGKQGAIGFDGIWRASGNGDIVAEIKTTDAYQINLDSIAGYRNRLIEEQTISRESSSILIVVGRQDTGGLEAQIRGSRHGWDIRLISVDALIQLMQLKETVEDPNIIDKICAILMPQEFTRVDGIIDLVFSTAEEVDVSSRSEVVEEDETEAVVEKTHPVNFYEACVIRISEKLQAAITKQSRTTYRSPERDLVVSLAISKEYTRSGQPFYWFAFHPTQKEQLERATEAYIAFGCGSSQTVFLFPLAVFLDWLEGLNQTVKETRFYWHIHITRSHGHWVLLRKSGYQPVDITSYLI